MGVVKAGNDRLAFKIDDLRSRPTQIREVVVHANSENPPVPHGQSLCHRLRGVQGINMAVQEKRVSVHHGLLLRSSDLSQKTDQ